MQFYYDSAHYAQMSVLIGKDLGDITNLANDFLPKSAIDRTTIRMAELLQHRMGATSALQTVSSSSNPTVSVKSTTETSIAPTNKLI